MFNYLSSWFNSKLTAKGNNLDRLYVQNLNYRDDIVAQGGAFYIDYHQTAIAAATKTYVQVHTPIDRYVALIDRELVTDKERAFYRVFTTYGSVTEGASIPVKSLRSNSPFTSGLTAFECTAPATIDQTSIVSNVAIFGSVGAGNRASGGINARGLFRLFQPNTTLLFEYENASVDPVYFSSMFAWFELPESAILT